MKKLLQIALLVIMLSACSANPIVPSQTPPDFTAAPTVTMMPPTVTQLPTGTPDVISTSTSQPIFAPTVIYDKTAGVESKCVAVNQTVQKDHLGTGVSVLESRESGSGFFVLNMQTGNSTDLVGKHNNFLDASVSPDGTLLAVYHVSGEIGNIKTELLLMTANGEIKKTFSWREEWGMDATWLDNQHLAFTILVPTDVINVGKSKMSILNALTGGHRILEPNFPDLYDSFGYPLPYWDKPWGGTLTAYNPSLTRAVYLGDPGSNYVLWDLQRKKSLLTWTQFVSIVQNTPRWSPDGTKFLMYGVLGTVDDISLPYKLYLVDNDGNPSELVAGFGIFDYFWSPSGRYVALELLGAKASDGYYNDRLAILDVQTKKITDYCVEFRSSAGDPSLIWSPDETQILLNDKYITGHWRVILVDLTKGTAFPIAEDMIATGWMKSP